MKPAIELVWVDRGSMDMGVQIQEHSHICYQLYYILQGRPEFVIDRQALQTRPHTFFYIPPNTPHRMLPVTAGGTRAYDLKFIIHDPFIREHLPAAPVLLEDDRLAEQMLSFIVGSWDDSDPQTVAVLDHLLVSLLSCFFLDTLRHDHHDSRASHHIDTETYSPVTCAVIKYIETHYSAPHFSLQSMSEALNYNKNYLSTVFSRDTGRSVVDYLNLIRIRKAIIFFALHNQDVFTTYESIGFTNPSHFSRVFKRLVGLPPRSFKQAFSTLDREALAALFTQEPLLNYSICPLEEVYASLHRIGAAAGKLTRP